MMRVKRGTCVLATAMTIFAPSLAMPPLSACTPTIKPVMFLQKQDGNLALVAQLDKMRPLE